MQTMTENEYDALCNDVLHDFGKSLVLRGNYIQ